VLGDIEDEVMCCAIGLRGGCFHCSTRFRFREEGGDGRKGLFDRRLGCVYRSLGEDGVLREIGSFLSTKGTKSTKGSLCFGLWEGRYTQCQKCDARTGGGLQGWVLGQCWMGWVMDAMDVTSGCNAVAGLMIRGDSVAKPQAAGRDCARDRS
jgi:hypothetical protein